MRTSRAARYVDDTSPQPFGLVVWGWGSAASTSFFSQAVSYAYPAGASVKQINQVVIQ